MRMTRDQEIQLGRLAMNGCQRSRNLLIENNMWLVPYEISGMNLSSWCDRDDFMQAGYEGLIEAAKSYDPDKGGFAAYAVKFIRGYITREYRKNGISASYSTKCHAAECMRKLEEIQNIYGVLDDREAASILGISIKTLNIYRRMNEQMASLNQLLYDSEKTLMDTIVYKEDTSIEDEIIHQAIQEMFRSLSSKQREIVEIYFGFADGRQHSFRETAEVCKVKEAYVKKQMPLIYDRMRHYAERTGLAEMYYGERR